MNQDTATQGYLSLFSQRQADFDAEVKKMDYLGDVRHCPASALYLHFLENGLVYPDFPEVTPAILRSILVDSERLHAWRYTLRGLVAYIEHFVTAGLTVTVTDAEKRVLWLSIANWGLPNANTLASTAGSFDECYYLYKNQDLRVTVSFSGAVSDAMIEFFRNTLKHELPFGQTDGCAIEIDY